MHASRHVVPRWNTSFLRTEDRSVPARRGASGTRDTAQRPLLSAPVRAAAIKLGGVQPCAACKFVCVVLCKQVRDSASLRLAVTLGAVPSCRARWSCVSSARSRRCGCPQARARVCAPDAAGAQLLPTRQGTGASSLHDAQREHERRQRCDTQRKRSRNCPDWCGCSQALLGGSESLARGTTRLEQGQRMLLETENIGNDVLVSLQRQRQQIKGAQYAPCLRAGALRLRQR